MSRNLFIQININSRCYVLQRTKYNNKIVSLRKITNGNVNAVCYYVKDILPPYLSSTSYNYYNTFSPLQIQMEEYDNIMDKRN